MKKFFALMMVTLMMGMMVSCSNDDEPTVDDSSLYASAVAMLYNGNTPKFTATDTEGIYLAWAEDEAEVANFIIALTGDTSWNRNDDLKVTLGDKGSFTVKGQTGDMAAEGIFNEVVVNIKGYTPYTLRIVTEERAKDYENSHWSEDGYSGGGVVRLEAR